MDFYLGTTSRNSTTPSPIPLNPKPAKRFKSLQITDDSSSAETGGNESVGDSEWENSTEPLTLNEIELVFKPQPTEMTGDNSLIKALKENSVRYIKTTANATGKYKFNIYKNHLSFMLKFNFFCIFLVDHLSKYLAMRLTLDLDTEGLSETDRLLNFCIYIAPSPGQYVAISGAQTLRQVNEKFWRINQPLEMFYSWKKT